MTVSNAMTITQALVIAQDVFEVTDNEKTINNIDKFIEKLTKQGDMETVDMIQAVEYMADARSIAEGEENEKAIKRLTAAIEEIKRIASN